MPFNPDRHRLPEIRLEVWNGSYSSTLTQMPTR